MAGAGYKLFNTGDVLTAAQVNTYLMEQTVMVFADATARTTALSGVVAEGMLSYLKSTKQVEVYNGSAWVASDDPNAIQNTIVDAKGDLIAASAADTPARLAVGNNGETLVADSSTTTGLRWQEDHNVGRNKFINSYFDFWQRGTSFSVGAFAYNADRFWSFQDGNGTATISRQTFSPQNDQVYFMRYSLTSLGTTTVAQIGQRIEGVDTLAGKTATFSTYVKADSNRTNLVTVFALQNFGAGGSADVVTNVGTFSVTSASFTRPTFTFTVPSVSGKTIGAGSFLQIYFQFTPATSLVLDTWGWQLEEGSVATRAVRAAGTLAGELSACQRYFISYGGGSAQNFATGQAYSGTQAWQFNIPFPVTMRTTPSVTISSAAHFRVSNSTAGNITTDTVTSTAGDLSPTTGALRATVASGLTAGNATALYAQSADARIQFGAEL